MKDGLTGTVPAYFFGRDGCDISGMLSGRRAAVFLDFDGTLTPIQNDPAGSVLSEEGKRCLHALADSGRHHVSLISGRGMNDLKSRVGIPNICYGGNHGLVISGGGMEFVHPGALAAKSLIDKAAGRLAREAGRFEGALVERKRFTVSLHYRMVDRQAVPQVKRAFHKVAAELSEDGRLTVIKGKKVLELTPDLSWDKGKAVMWILDQLKDSVLAIFIGDDFTDESAFKVLKRKGITVRVGKSKRTLASFYLKDYRETFRLLKSIQTIDGREKV
jgi:trehalose 6-phosphate phosphatase